MVEEELRWPRSLGFQLPAGVSADKSILRLRDGVFKDSQKPQSMMWCGGFGSADWFHNYVQGLTFDVGRQNPGAIALQFYSKNSGAVRNCRFIADPSSGHIGLDLKHRDMNGPLLVSNCEIIGFERGIATGHAVNGQTFEHITLRGQRQFGWTNEGQTIAVRGLLSHNRVPVLQTYGACCLIQSQLHGLDKPTAPAIINFNSGSIYLRDVESDGYPRLLADLKTPDSAAAFRLTANEQQETVGPTISEYWSSVDGLPYRVGKLGSTIDVREPPLPLHVPVTEWANVDDFGADPTGVKDSSASIQKAIDSGAQVIFFPGSYALRSTLIVRGKVRRLVGIGGWLDYTRQVTPDIRIEGDNDSLTLEHFANVHGGVEIDSARTVVFRSVSDCDLTFTAKARNGHLFFEDFVTHNLQLDGQKVWARQLNVENEGTHVTNTQSDLWILGFKTERGGTLLHNRAGARTEVLGGFSYTTTAGKLAPMFINDNSSLFTYFNEVCFNGDPFQTLLVERQESEKTYRRGQTSLMPYRSSQ